MHPLYFLELIRFQIILKTKKKKNNPSVGPWSHDMTFKVAIAEKVLTTPKRYFGHFEVTVRHFLQKVIVEN